MTKNDKLKYGSIALMTLGAGTIVAALLHKPKIDISKQRIYLIGDSLAVGLKTPLAAIAASQNVPFGSTAKGGTAMTHWIKPSWWQYEKEFNPTILLISLGTNDAYGFVDPNKVPEYIEQIKKLAGNARIYWIMPPNVKMKNINAIRQKILQTEVENFASDQLNINLPDGVHPSGQGYEKWAKEIWQALANLRVK